MKRLVYVGIDVSKRKLDVAVKIAGDAPSGPRRRADETWTSINDEQGIIALVERLRAIQPQRIVLELTGGYERKALALSHRLVAESPCLRTQAEAYERLAWLLEGPDADAAWAESGRMWHLVGDLEKIWMWTSGSAWAKFHASDLSGAKRHYTEALALTDAWELSDAMERELRLMRQAFGLA